jgi:hypothetical protein
MLISGDDHGSRNLSEGKQVVVARVTRATRRRWRIGFLDGGAAEELDELTGFLSCYSRSQLRVGERSLELGQEALGDDELEVTGEPAREDLRRCPARREQSRYEDVGVEDSAHSAPSTPSFVLRLDCECGSILLGEIVSLPETIEQIKAELAPKRLLDDLAVPLARAGGPDLDRAQHVLVDRERCTNLRHICILASSCFRAVSSELLRNPQSPDEQRSGRQTIHSGDVR